MVSLMLTVRYKYSCEWFRPGIVRRGQIDINESWFRKERYLGALNHQGRQIFARRIVCWLHLLSQIVTTLNFAHLIAGFILGSFRVRIWNERLTHAWFLWKDAMQDSSGIAAQSKADRRKWSGRKGGMSEKYLFYLLSLFFNISFWFVFSLTSFFHSFIFFFVADYCFFRSISALFAMRICGLDDADLVDGVVVVEVALHFTVNLRDDLV